MSKTGLLLAELRQRRQERLELVLRLKSRQEWELFCQNLQQKYPEHWHLLRPRLPNPNLLLEKFDVTWSLNPLTPLNPSAINFGAINETDKQAIIEESNRMAHQMARTRAQSIVEVVFGEMLQTCDQIIKGSFETGRRKFASVDMLINQIERLRNFSEFGTPEISQRADQALCALKTLSSTEIESLNSNQGKNAITAAIKAAVVPVQQEIAAMYAAAEVGSGKARRSLE